MIIWICWDIWVSQHNIALFDACRQQPQIVAVLEQYCKKFINELVFDQLLSQSDFAKLLTLSHQSRELSWYKLVLFITESLHLKVFWRHNKVLYFSLKLKVDNNSEGKKDQRHYLPSQQLLEPLLGFIDVPLFIDYSLFRLGILSGVLTEGDQHYRIARLSLKRDMFPSSWSQFHH